MLNRLMVVLLALSETLTAAAQAAPRVAVVPSLVKVRPTLPLPPEARANSPVELTAARGECEEAQVVVTAPTEGLQHLDASATSLRLAGAQSTQLSVTLYREAFLNIQKASDIEGAVGLWPDPLIPVVDEITHERRNAFPIDVPPGWHQPMLVEVCVPHSAPAGSYAGEVIVSAREMPPTRVPIQLTVKPIAIPATSSIPVTFGLDGRSLLFGHYGEERTDAEELELVRRYAWDALRHRISVNEMTRRPPHVFGSGNQLQVDFRQWDAEIEPYMDGRVGLDGARFSAVDLRTPRRLSGPDLTAYYRAVEQHFRARGWLDRLFAYVMDEPKPSQQEELVRRLDALAPARGIRRMVTTPLQNTLLGKIDIWAPNLNCLEYKRKPTEFCHLFTPRSDYDQRLALREQLWWYQSCSSHGCKGPMGTSTDSYFTGWPSYMVDIDGAAARIMGWLAMANDIGGELYYETVLAYGQYRKTSQPRVDPWDSLWAFGGNGDGTLFYPGRPDRIGGSTDIPIESLRLKYIRDGLEDYELLRLLAAQGPAGAEQAHRLARRMAPRLFEYQRSAASFDQARRELFDALEKSSALSSAAPGSPSH